MLKNNLKYDIAGAYGHTPLKFVMTALLLVGLSAAGCKKEEAAPVQVAPVRKVVAPVQAVMTSAKKPEYVYDPSGKRDPFKTFIDLSKKERLLAPSTPLQNYDLNALRLVGVLMLPGNKVAIIEDPTGKGYHVKVGTQIGMNNGVVVEILSDEIVVEEKSLNETTQINARRVSIKIPKEQGQGGEGR